MMHKAWCSREEVPYCISGSSIKFQGHTGWKIGNLKPILSKITRPVAAIKSLRFAFLIFMSHNFLLQFMILWIILYRNDCIFVSRKQMYGLKNTSVHSSSDIPKYSWSGDLLKSTQISYLYIERVNFYSVLKIYELVSVAMLLCHTVEEIHVVCYVLSSLYNLARPAGHAQVE